MNRLVGPSVGFLALVSAVVGVGQPGVERTAAAQARPTSAAREAPTFKVDPSWPKVPNQWILGIVSSSNVDSQDNVWVLQRPRTLSAEEKSKAAPPVLEFNAAGDFIQAWGGPGEGYEWPNTEHGIYVDPRGFVWIGGSGPKRTLPLVARYADVWHAYGSPATLAELSARIDTLAAEIGRDPGAIRRASSLSLSEPEDAIRANIEALQKVGISYLICGWPGEGRERVESFATNVMADYAG